MEKLSYKTISHNNKFEIEKIKGSRFIGYIIKAETKEEAELELEALRKQNYNATHNCFAYTVGIKDDPVTRFSDDGEPSGTAGRPIMTILDSSGLKNILLVVTRYYGGTKLGTGGLIKAYGEAAKAVISNSKIVDIEIKTLVEFRYKYDITSMVMNLISRYEATIEDEIYNEDVFVKVWINNNFLDKFKTEIFDKSNGKIIVKGSE